MVAGVQPKNTGNKFVTVFFGGLGGCLPDIDTISLWSGFDHYFGNFLHLQDSGRDIYFGKAWYSHHAFFHSIAAIIFYLIVLEWFYKLFSWKFKNSYPNKIFLSFAFAFGYFMHLLEDMPTPGGSWGGINLFWPLQNYTGGTGQIWWWNNYDIFLLIFAALVVNIAVLLLSFRFQINKFSTVIIGFLGLILVFFQIQSKSDNFNAPVFPSKAERSLEIQKDILGDELYNFMVKFDKSVKMHF